MASVVTAAPTDGAPLLALHKLDKRFGATHALKVVIGKWLNHGAKLFIFDEPTVGVDVGAKAEIYRLLASLLAKGAGVIMVSSYPPEVYKPADTLHVFRAGGLLASNGHKDATQETILTEAIGV
jgi:ribose transport system ATP-binding protein